VPVPEHDQLQWVVSQAVKKGEILRLRLRNLADQVVYSDDGSGFSDRPEDEALDAARGKVVAQLTRLNKDSNDTGAAGVAAVEVYQPLMVGQPAHRVGVLELYLPYAPIAREIAAALRVTYLVLAVGLVALYLVLLAISASVTRGLRREAATNAFLAGHDALSGLPNRVLFHEQGRRSVARPGRRREPVAVAIIDLDRFKAVNDTLGHHNGDELIKQVASRLAGTVREGDTVARLGGDEFGLILTNPQDAADALFRIRSVIEEELEIQGLPLSVEASIGYAVAPADGQDFDELLQKADVALYHAKEHHLGVARHEASQNSYDAASLALVAELRRAITEDQLVLHYQPKTRLADGRVDAVEALVRWRHPVQGLLYPDRFLPLVEQTDLIDELTRWVVQRALTDLRFLPGGMAVAVNISARNLARPGFADEVRAAVSREGVDPARLTVELTETALLADPGRASETLAQLAALGIRASIDDFGRGHTSLGYLSELPLAEIKIDRSFVSDMVRNSGHAAIVRSVVELGHNLGLAVVGEGVETDDVRQQLDDVGCDVAQGYLFARPMPVADLHTWLQGISEAGSSPNPLPRSAVLG
jgi:diguanylate cyclase (GGDEF)-like protein